MTPLLDPNADRMAYEDCKLWLTRMFTTFYVLEVQHLEPEERKEALLFLFTMIEELDLLNDY